MTLRLGRTILPGALFALSHFLSTPGYGVASLAWGAWIPFLFLVEESADPASALRRAFAASLAAVLPLYYWIAWTVAVPGKLGWAAGAAAALLVSAFVAMHHAVAAWGTRRCVERFGPPGLLAFPAVAGAVELSRLHLFSGFPWMLAGYSLVDDPLLRQGASLVGTGGLGVALFAVSTIAYTALRHGGGRGRRALLLASAAAIPGALAAFGVVRLERLEGAPPPAGAARRVAIVQGAVDQSVKWDPAFRAETLRIYGDLSREAAPGKDLVVWPETAAPFFYGWEKEETARLRAIAAGVGVPVLFGVPWMEADGTVPARVRFYNSILLLDGTGTESGRYDKRHLVPFGEYIPLRALLGFLNKLTEGGEDFSTGEGPAVLRAGGMALGPSVCYEAIFPSIQRETVRAGADVLVNVTNDSWFGDTVAPWQHLAMARMRSVETGRPMVRAANAGVSAFIGADGSLRGTLGIGRKGVLEGAVHPSGEVTPYSKWGDVLPLLCGIITLLLLGVTCKGRPCPRE